MLWDYIQPGLQNDYRTIDNCYGDIAERSHEQKTIDNSQKININIFPNPSNGTVNIELDSYIDEGVLTVQDVLGREVYSQRIDVQQENIQLDFSSLKGMYLISIRDGNALIKTNKVVIH